MADGRVVVRIDGKRYERQATRVTDPVRLDALRSALGRKYGVTGPTAATTPGSSAGSAPLRDRRIPVLLVSGFLGSGKTTLVRWLLPSAQRRGVRVAVITNELGELGIDGALLASAGRQLELAAAASAAACRRLRRDARAPARAPDRVIVETSGVALPTRRSSSSGASRSRAGSATTSRWWW